jgi:hypothetical protein
LLPLCDGEEQVAAWAEATALAQDIAEGLPAERLAAWWARAGAEGLRG